MVSVLEIKFLDSRGRIARNVKKLTSLAKYLKHLKGQSVSNVQVGEILTDVYIVRESGELRLVAEKVHPSKAAKWAHEWTLLDRSNGCLLWPSGLPLPESLIVGNIEGGVS